MDDSGPIESDHESHLKRSVPVFVNYAIDVPLKGLPVCQELLAIPIPTALTVETLLRCTNLSDRCLLWFDRSFYVLHVFPVLNA